MTSLSSRSGLIGGALWSVAVLVTPAGADFSPGIEVTEVMMEAQGSDAAQIGRVLGADESSPLTYTSFVDVAAQSYSYTLDPGQTYLGQPASLSGSGYFDAGANAWVLSSTGSIGGETWTSSGMGAIVGDPQGQFDVVIGPLDFHIDVDWAEYEEQIDSVFEVKFTILGIEIAKTNGWDVYSKATKEWEWHFSRVDVLGKQVAVDSRGSSPTPSGGFGSFTQTILVPEPASLLLLALTGAGLSKRQRRTRFTC